jgi:formylglycine-generating enzyme required for sulfatase activity
VWKWTSSLFRPYPFTATDGTEQTEWSEHRVLRGGSANSARAPRVALRIHAHLGGFEKFTGFRLGQAVPSS